MHDSTVFRDLALYLEREATRLHGLGYAEWADHFLEDADRLLGYAEYLTQAEPPLPSVESLAGIDPGFKPAEPELERLRQRAAALLIYVQHTSRCQTNHPGEPPWPCSCGLAALRLAHEGLP